MKKLEIVMVETKYSSKLLIIVISISLIAVSCSNKSQDISNSAINQKEYYINVFLNEFCFDETEAFIVVYVRNKSTILPAITTINCLVSYVIDNSSNHDLSNKFIKDECRNYLLNDSVLKYKIGILYTPDSTEELWATKGENEYIIHYILEPPFIREDLTEQELLAVIYRLINWGYFVQLGDWGYQVIKLE